MQFWMVAAQTDPFPDCVEADPAADGEYTLFPE
jgi:hypothetical protein